MNFSDLPESLPRPIDDGAAVHLKGMRLPQLSLTATNGKSIALSQLHGWVVIYVYPMTGRPDRPLPEDWDSIPGARGCTPQSCSFRDHYAELRSLSASIYGLSAQSSSYQQEARERLHLPFQLLSDTDLELKAQLGLPTFQVATMELYKRLTLISYDSTIRKVFYPIFPPDIDAGQVLGWLKANA
jgi:peroxiredoxin